VLLPRWNGLNGCFESKAPSKLFNANSLTSVDKRGRWPHGKDVLTGVRFHHLQFWSGSIEKVPETSCIERSNRAIP
jgi:hypothetical protein